MSEDDEIEFLNKHYKMIDPKARGSLRQMAVHLAKEFPLKAKPNLKLVSSDGSRKTGTIDKARSGREIEEYIAQTFQLLFKNAIVTKPHADHEIYCADWGSGTMIYQAKKYLGKT
jgi:hypothetical protein